MNLARLVRKWHKWFSLVVGLQLLLWTLSGFVMSFLPMEDVRSEKRILPNPHSVLKDTDRYLSPSEAFTRANIAVKELTSLRIKNILDQPFYEVKLSSAQSYLINALDGRRIDTIDASLAAKIARSRYRGNALIQKSELLVNEIIEYRGEYPVWRLTFGDEEGTRFYVSATTGDLKAVTNTVWSIYDFFWMLHIMDYSERENTNTWWLVLSSFLAVISSLTGIWLCYFTFKKGHFLFFNSRK